MSDPRFARLRTDPRFRKPKKSQSKVVIDERFKSLFDDDKSGKQSKPKGVDKYGRNVSEKKGKDDLKRFYRLDGDESTAGPSKIDLARGEGLLESSSEEEDDQQSDVDSHNSDEEGTDDNIVLRRHNSKPKALVDLENLEVDLDEDDDALAVLDAQAAAYSRDHPEPQSNTTEGAQTHRLAVVNLDWDHVRASHLYKIFSSLLSPELSTGSAGTVRGAVNSIRVYPSEFGKERMQKEEVEGPPKELFHKQRDVDGVLVQEDDGNEYDEEALRQYHLERLRYYYAIVTCDTPKTAAHLIGELDGTELERTANVFDLSFVPEDMEFDKEFRDEATATTVIDGPAFKGLDFSTDALRHSKVKLKWDEDDPDRDRITRKALTKKDIDEGNFNALIASSSGSEASDAEGSGTKTQMKNVRRKEKGDREKIRSLLLNADDDELPEGWGGDGFDDNDVGRDGGMEITFMPALSSTKVNSDDETTLDTYKRRQKEKRMKRKEEWLGKSKAKEEVKTLKDEFFGDDSGEEDNGKEASRREATREELELVAAPDDAFAHAKHFDMNAVIKSDKKQRKRNGKKALQKRGEDDNEDMAQGDFNVDVTDSRFRAIHDDSTFAIDPTNPHFKKTKGMAAILGERTKRRQGAPVTESYLRKVSDQSTTESQSLQKLVESVKRKSTDHGGKGVGKRRKL